MTVTRQHRAGDGQTFQIAAAQRHIAVAVNAAGAAQGQAAQTAQARQIRTVQVRHAQRIGCCVTQADLRRTQAQARTRAQVQMALQAHAHGRVQPSRTGRVQAGPADHVQAPLLRWRSACLPFNRQALGRTERHHRRVAAPGHRVYVQGLHRVGHRARGLHLRLRRQLQAVARRQQPLGSLQRLAAVVNAQVVRRHLQMHAIGLPHTLAAEQHTLCTQGHQFAGQDLHALACVGVGCIDHRQVRRPHVHRAPLAFCGAQLGRALQTQNTGLAGLRRQDLNIQMPGIGRQGRVGHAFAHGLGLKEIVGVVQLELAALGNHPSRQHFEA